MLTAAIAGPTYLSILHHPPYRSLPPLPFSLSLSLSVRAIIPSRPMQRQRIVEAEQLLRIPLPLQPREAL